MFLAYNKDKLRQLGIVPDTWAVIFDPKYLNKLKGKVTVFDSSRNVIAAALLYLGKDPNSENKADLDAARAVIDRAAPYWAKFDSDSYYRGLLRGDVWVSMSYSIDILKQYKMLKPHMPRLILMQCCKKKAICMNWIIWLFQYLTKMIN